MERLVVIVSAVVMVLAGPADNGTCMNPYAGSSGCAPPCRYVTKMVPCVKTELVPQVVPCTAVVPEKRIGFRCQKVLLRGVPVGPPHGANACTRCCPEPFCRVVVQKVPYAYCVPKCRPYYNVVYRRVCRTVWLPQTYKVDAIPLCR